MIFNILASREVGYMEEKAHFKYFFQRYWHKRNKKTGLIEFWCFPSIKNQYESGDYFLGKLINGEIIKADNFYQLPWVIQKGAIRLFEKYEKENLK